MSKWLLCLMMAMAALLCACAAVEQGPETTISPTAASTQSPPEQPATDPADAQTTVPSAPTQTAPAGTTEPTETTPPETTKPTETIPVETKPTEPVTVPFLPEQIISETASEIKKVMPELKFDPAQQTGAAIELSVGVGITHTDAVAELHDTLLDLFDYNLYLEQQISPEQIQPVIFDYTYSIRYLGLNADKTLHIFEICYVVNKQTYVSDIFDSDEIIRLVTEAVEKSDQIKVTSFSDDNHTRVVMYDDVPFFYTTQQSAEWLADSVVNEIYGENLGVVKYIQFRLVFHSKGETSYVFLLYLR